MVGEVEPEVVRSSRDWVFNGHVVGSSVSDVSMKRKEGIDGAFDVDLVPSIEPLSRPRMMRKRSMER
jgi:hypothetical protein